jgi:heat shock protein HtpX
MAAYGLHTHIRSNRARSVFLMIGLFILVYILLFAFCLAAEAFLNQDATLSWILTRAIWDFSALWPWATFATVIWILIAWKWHQKMIDSVTGGEIVTRQQEPKLYNLLENLCISRGIPMPKLKVMPSSALNAFATGLNEKQYSITVTRDLVKRLKDDEIEAVLGHELTHIRNGDVQLMVIAVVIAGIVSFFGELLFRGFFRTNRSWSTRSSGGSSSNRKGGGGAVIAILIAVALVAIAWLLSIVVKMSLSRSREYLADAGSVELTKNPDAMIRALRKIEGRGELEGSTSSIMEMCLDNPRSGFVDLFATHPSIDARVDALIRYAGGNDPGPIAMPEVDRAIAHENETGDLPPMPTEQPAPAPGPWTQPEPKVNPWDR